MGYPAISSDGNETNKQANKQTKQKYFETKLAWLIRVCEDNSSMQDVQVCWYAVGVQTHMVGPTVAGGVVHEVKLDLELT